MSQTELILNPDSSIYHLGLKPGELAKKIIFVGDPARVDRVAEHFEDVTIRRKKREFHTVTGIYKSTPISVISTGIGTDNIDIVWNEIDALFNVNFSDQTVKESLTSLKVLRLGTCGGLQPHIPVGTVVYSRFAIGADAMMQYYAQERTVSHATLEEKLSEFVKKRLGLRVRMYGSVGSGSLERLIHEHYPQVESGITFTAAGFYGPQGRSLGRIPLLKQDLIDGVSKFSFGDREVLNMEMETSGILGLSQALGHRAGSLSVILANRRTGEFSEDPTGHIEDLIQKGLHILHKW
ncbi:nucleoside phosphorylase [Pontibacter sp. G13]|uniref:nucleoside phosphorylase n=1 Tax=Pontibacter sp. G13 TaxID=3074898 RepID=UPI00288C1399|nr:nucleoside phosphorylase [Pontibacter sp. G13]WNJ20489.1 nucleoside phosphorylase [Pontibacter sp. G13]